MTMTVVVYCCVVVPERVVVFNFRTDLRAGTFKRSHVLSF